MPEEEPFAKATVSVLRDDRISDRCFRVYMAIVHRIGDNGHCWPSKKVLAKDLGRSARSIQYSLQELSDIGIIEIERHSGRTSHYRMRSKNLPVRQTDEGKNLLGGEQELARGGARTCSGYKNKNQEQEPRTRESDLDTEIEDPLLWGTAIEASFNVKLPPSGKTDRYPDVVRVMEAWHTHIGPIRTLTTKAGAHILWRLADWTAEELISAVVGYGKQTAKWRGNGHKATTPERFFATDELVQQYVGDGAEDVPIDELPPIMRRLTQREFPNVQAHREALMKIEARLESDKGLGIAIETAMDKSNLSVPQFLERIEKRTGNE